MKSNKGQTTVRYVLSFICFTVYLSLLVTAAASALNTDLYTFLLG